MNNEIDNQKAEAELMEYLGVGDVGSVIATLRTIDDDPEGELEILRLMNAKEISDNTRRYIRNLGEPKKASFDEAEVETGKNVAA